MPKPSTRKSAVPLTPAPAPSTATPAHKDEPPTRLTPVAEKVGEGPGNLKARELAYKRRSGAR